MFGFDALKGSKGPGAKKLFPDWMYGLKIGSGDNTLFSLQILKELAIPEKWKEGIRLDCLNELNEQTTASNIAKTLRKCQLIYPYCIVELKACHCSQPQRAKYIEECKLDDVKKQLRQNVLRVLKRLDALMKQPGSADEYGKGGKYQRKTKDLSTRKVVPVIGVTCKSAVWRVYVCWTQATEKSESDATVPYTFSHVRVSERYNPEGPLLILHL